MSKFRIVNLIDKIFLTISLFLLCFAWINFYLRSLWTSFILSTIISIALISVIYFFINRKQTKIKNIKVNNEKIDTTFLAFKLTSKEEKLKLLNKIYSKNFETKIKKGTLFYNKDNKTHQVILATHFEKLDQRTLVNLLDENISEVDCYDIICNKTEFVNLNIFAKKSVEIINKENLYKLFVENDIFPDIDMLAKNINKPKFKDILRQFFVPSKSKSYFLCGLILLLSSIILPYHYYYIIFGSVLLIFSVICKLIPKFKD